MERKLTVADIFGETARLAGDNAGATLGCLAGLSALNVLFDQALPVNGSSILGGVATLGAEYWLITQTLGRLGLRNGNAGFASYFGLGILSGFAILLGFILLIIPGMILLARWSAADAVLLAEGEGVTAALGRSWQMTAPNVWPISGAILVTLVPAFGIGLGVTFSLGTAMPILASVVMNTLSMAGSVLSWLMGVAIYTLLRPGNEALAEVFA